MFGKITIWHTPNAIILVNYDSSKSLDKRAPVIITFMNTDNVDNSVMTGPSGVGSAEGVSKSNWYVAIVKNNTEKSVYRNLVNLGYECYVPLQNELRIWKNGRRSFIERIVIPTIVFINCTESIRKEIISLPYIIRFMSNRAGTSSNGLNKPLAIVPETQIKKLMFMVGNSDTPVTFSSTIYRKGDLVRVVRGKLVGLEGEVNAIDDKHSEVIVRLDFLGSARLTIETADIEPIK